MSNFSKKFVILLAVAMLALLAAQCGGQPQVVEKIVEKEVTKIVEKEVTKEVEKIVEKEVTKEVEKEVVKNVKPIIYNSNNSDPNVRKVDEMLVKMFNEKNPDFPIQHSIVQHEDFKQAIRAYLVAEPAPDVMTWFAGNRARFFINKGLILDISDVWQKEGWNDNYPKGFRALSEVNGKAYFLPTNWYWWAVFYRKSILEANKITPPQTFDELLTACDTLNKAGITPIAIGTKAPWTAAAWFDYLDMRTNGPEFHLNLMLGKEKYNDPKVKAVFANWKKLFDHKCFAENPAAYDWQNAVDPLNQGKAAMYLMGQFILDTVAENVKPDMDFFRFPIIDPKMKIGEDAPTDGFFMSAKAQNPEGGKKFLAFLGSVEAQTVYVKELGRISANTKVDSKLYPPMTQKGIELIKAADLVLQFYDRDTTPEMAEEGMNAFTAFWADPSKIDGLLDNLEAKRLELFVEETK